MFCQEDRAILCRDCDDPIHSANDLTMRHNRFLLTGVRLSTAPITPSPSSSSPESNSRSPGDEKVVGNTNSKNSTANAKQDKNLAAEGSSISEYLTKVCPGWHVEDLLIDGDDIVVGGFSKVHHFKTESLFRSLCLFGLAFSVCYISWLARLTTISFDNTRLLPLSDLSTTSAVQQL